MTDPELNKQLGILVMCVLQDCHQEAKDIAKDIKLDFPEGEPIIARLRMIEPSAPADIEARAKELLAALHGRAPSDARQIEAVLFQDCLEKTLTANDSIFMGYTQPIAEFYAAVPELVAGLLAELQTVRQERDAALTNLRERAARLADENDDPSIACYIRYLPLHEEVE